MTEVKHYQHARYRRGVVTVTDIVIAVLRAAPEDTPWLTMREIIELAAKHRETIAVSAVASALANIESGLLYVDRSRRPFRYRFRLPLRDPT